MKLKIFTVIFCCLLTAMSINAQNKANQPDVSLKFGKGLKVTAADSSAYMKANVRFQSLYTSERSLADGSDWESKFMVRRARMKFSGWALSPKLGYKMEFALSNRDLNTSKDFDETSEAPKIVLDAVLKWKAHKNWTIWMGQTKLPGNRERVVSSQTLQMVDRSLVNSIFNLERDMGLQLRGKYKLGSGVIKPTVSWSFGEGRNVTDANIGGFQYIGHLEWLPFGEFAGKGDYVGADLKREKTPKLALATSYSLNQGAARQKQSGRFLSDADGNYLTNDLQTIFVDMMFKYQGFSLMGEYAHKIVANEAIKNDSDLRLNLVDANGRSYLTGSGINIQTGYLFKNNVELSARYTNVMPDTDVSFDGAQEYTLGVSKYIVGHALKIQGDVALTDEVGAMDNNLRYRLQVEFQF